MKTTIESITKFIFQQSSWSWKVSRIINPGRIIIIDDDDNAFVIETKCIYENPIKLKSHRWCEHCEKRLELDERIIIDDRIYCKTCSKCSSRTWIDLECEHGID